MSTLQIIRFKTLATEIFKTFHSLNPIYMNEIFQTNPLKTRNLRSRNNLITHRYNSITYGKNSLRILGPTIWNTKQQKIFKHQKTSEAVERPTMQL